MNRDGATRSIWQSEPEYQSANNWSPAEVYDVLVVGAGITGLTTALLLQEKGKKVILAEAYNVGFGTTGGTTAHLNTMLDTSYDIVERDFGKEGAKLFHDGARGGIDLIDSLVSKYGVDCAFSYQPGYIFAQNEDEEKQLEKLKDASARAGVDISWADAIPVPVDFTKAVRFEREAQFHPTRYLLGLAKAFESLGGILLQHCLVKSAEHKELFTAETTLGAIQAQKIVWATHMPPGINLLDFMNAPYRSYAMAVRLNDDSQYPDGLAYDLKEPYHYYRTLEADGNKYLIAGGNDHKTGHNTNTEHVFTELEAYLRQYFDIAGIDYRWSSQYFEPVDGLPYIGQLPGHPGEYCATGFSGNGLVLGSLSAKVLADVLTGQESSYGDLFSTTRIKPMAGFAEFVKENADVAMKYVGMRFAYESIRELSEIAPGEARLVNYNGDKLGIYKDEAGLVHAVNPVCPHAKCIVAWNTAEKTWDCPCHGGRFAPTGEVVTGPPRQSLELIQWKSLEGD